MSRVEWSQPGAEAVEGVVAVMLCRENPEATRVKASRGDGGIDVLVPLRGNSRRVEVYQVKSFTGRLTASRRRQIEKSLHRVVQFCADQHLELVAWYLTVPVTPTNEELGWFRGVVEAVEVPCHWRGLDFLEGLVARYPDVIDYYLHHGRDRLERTVASLTDALLAAQRVARRPTAAVQPPGGDREPGPLQPVEAFDGLRGLYQVLNRDDPHFRYDVAASGHCPPVDPDQYLLLAVVQQGNDDIGWITATIFARFKEAVLERPVPGVVTIDASASEDLARDLELFNDYGRGFRAPAGTVSSEVDLPGGLGGRLDGAALEVRPAGPVSTSGPPAGPPAPPGADGEELLLAVLDTAGTVIAETRVIMESYTTGAVGVARTGHEQHGVFSTEMLTDWTTKRTSFSISSKPVAGMRPALLLDGFRFLVAFHAPHRFRLARTYGPGSSSEAIPEGAVVHPEARRLHELVEALATVQEATVEPIVVPEALSDDEWDAVLTTARLLRGETISVTWGRIHARLPASASASPGARFAMRGLLPLTLDLPERSLDLGSCQLDVPIARVDPDSFAPAGPPPQPSAEAPCVEDARQSDESFEVVLVPAGSDVAALSLRSDPPDPSFVPPGESGL